MRSFKTENWLFVGSDTGGERTAVIYNIIETAKLNAPDLDPLSGWSVPPY